MWNPHIHMSLLFEVTLQWYTLGLPINWTWDTSLGIGILFWSLFFQKVEEREQENVKENRKSQVCYQIFITVTKIPEKNNKGRKILIAHGFKAVFNADWSFCFLMATRRGERERQNDCASAFIFLLFLFCLNPQSSW
jgi:hypothetical protein